MGRSPDELVTEISRQPSPDPQFVFRALGGLALQDRAGKSLPAVLAQPKRLALLLYLALSRAAGSGGIIELVRRDTLVGLFWPELDQPHARGALRKALQFLRSWVGEGAVLTRGEEEVGIDPLLLWCDAAAFLRALDERRPGDAIALYQGDLAPGLFVAGAPAVEEWLEGERARLRGLAARTARGLGGECEAAGTLTLAIDWARRVTALAPDDERAWRELIALLDRAGDRAGAVRAYEALVAQLAADYEVEPSPETQQLIASIRARVAGTAQIETRSTPAISSADPPGDTILAIGGVFAARYLLEREITRPSGMARVFVARDLKHDRRVALKVLSAELAIGEGRERFLREIRITARLNHPHIVTLFDSGELRGLLYYVMPFIEGETLRDRLERERPLPIDAALAIANQAAAALEYAHRSGVVHRDMKPENILLHSGEALVADFGIAHAMRLAAGTDGDRARERLTAAGLALGTPAYMSPEQAAGMRSPDARSDVYSLAAVLYEMLTGEPPHTGPDAAAILCRVLTEPLRPARASREAVPPHVDRALRKALSRLPVDRFDSAANFARALSEGASDRIALRLPRWFPGVAVLALGALGIGALVGTWVPLRSRPGGPREADAVRRWDILLPDSAPLAFVGAAPLGIGHASLALSPDGSRLVYVAQRGTATQLYLRHLDQLDAMPLRGTEGAYRPFFSPDGQWIGFFAGREVKKVSVGGGPPVSLAVTTEPHGAAWASDDRILVIDLQGGRLTWVPSGGGPPQPIERRVWMRVFQPQLLDGSKWVLHGSWDGVIYLLSLEDGWPYAVTLKGVVRRDSVEPNQMLYGANPQYLESGHIAYFSGDGTLMALPFDLSRRRVLGPPAPVLDRVRIEAEGGEVQLVTSKSGTLVYAPGESARLAHFVWVEHGTGRIDTLPLPRASYGSFDLSPDGRQILAPVRLASGRSEIWILSVDGTARARVPTHGIPRTGGARWWPDGLRMLYHEFQRDGGMPRFALRQLAGSPGRRDTIRLSGLGFEPGPDSNHIVEDEDGDLWLTRIDSAGPRIRLTPASVEAYFPAFSPDARWLAYTDTEDPSGQSEVYVTGVGGPAERLKISGAGGEEPVWTPDGRTVVYRNQQEWFGVDVATTGELRAAPPRLLFRGPFLQVPGVSHDVARDGRRQLVLLGPAAQTTNRLVVVTNWFQEVQRLARPNP
jgi:DNA-binding SARP family transcriptional activator/Tol biopolymer transport system component